MADPQGSTGAEEPHDAESPLADNPPGFVNPGQGINDLAGKDHAFRRAAMRMEQLEQRESAVNSSGFKLDAEAMRELQPEWEAVAEELMALRDKSQHLGHAGPPAPDEASTKQIQAVYAHARVCSEIHAQMYVYAREYATRLGDAINKYSDSEQAAQESLHSAGRDA